MDKLERARQLNVPGDPGLHFSQPQDVRMLRLASRTQRSAAPARLQATFANAGPGKVTPVRRLN